VEEYGFDTEDISIDVRSHTELHVSHERSEEFGRQGYQQSLGSSANAAAQGKACVYLV
jgi:hypothetical protein